MAKLLHLTALFLLLIQHITSFTNSTGILSEDWEKIEKAIKDCEGEETCLRNVYNGNNGDNMPKELHDYLESLYTEVMNDHINKMKRDLQFKYNVANETLSEMIIDNLTLNATSLKNTIQTSSSWNSTKDTLKKEYVNNIDNLVDKTITELKETIYYKDDNYDTTAKTITSVLKPLATKFYENELNFFLNQAFNKVYPEEKLNDLINNTKTQQEEWSKYLEVQIVNKSQFTSFKTQLIKWSLYISLNYSSTTSQEEDNKEYAFLTDPTNVTLALMKKDNTSVCTIPMKKSILNSDNDNNINLTFTFDDSSCKTKLTKDTTYYFASITEVVNFVYYKRTFVYKNISFKYLTDNQIIDSSTIDGATISNTECTLPNVLNLKTSDSKKQNKYYIEYSFDNEAFSYKEFTNGLSLRSYGSNKLHFIIHSSEGIILAKQNCIYNGVTEETLKETWDTFHKNVPDLSDETAIKNEIKNLPKDLYELIITYYMEKRNYLSKLFENDVSTHLKPEIESFITTYYANEVKRIQYISSAGINCTTNIPELFHEDIYNLIKTTVINKHKYTIDEFLPNGVKLLCERIYFKDPLCHHTYETIIKPNTTDIARILINDRLIKILNGTLKNNNYTGISSKHCEKANNVLTGIKSKNIYFPVNETESCFVPLKEDMFDWALTLAFNIKEPTTKNENNTAHCMLTTNTVFFLTTNNTNPYDNLIQCELHMKRNMLTDNILSLNFKDGNCVHFPFPNIQTYYLGTKVTITTPYGTYQQQFILNSLTINYHHKIIPFTDKNVILNYSESSFTCTLPKQIQFTDPTMANSVSYIEYSYDNKNFAFEPMKYIHQLPSQDSSTTSVLIYKDAKLIFVAHNCKYNGALTCTDCKNSIACVVNRDKYTCVCEDGFYGDTCEERTSNEDVVKEINTELYTILSDDDLIVDIDRNVASINKNKVPTMKKLINLMHHARKHKNDINDIANITQINTLNSITENYLTNSQHDSNSIYLLGLALNANILKLQRKRSKLRHLQSDITESEEMIKHKLEHLLHLGVIHFSTKPINTTLTTSSLELVDGTVYVHQWTSKSAHSAYDAATRHNLTTLSQMVVPCVNQQTDQLQYTLAELPRDLVNDIYDNNSTSNAVSFYIRHINEPSTSLSCLTVKFEIPSNGMNVSSNFKLNGKDEVNIYDANNTFFEDKCYRSDDFDFDLTEKVKNDIVEKEGIKIISPLSKNCYPLLYNKNSQRATIECSVDDMDLMVAFEVKDFNDKIEAGSLFECSTDIKDIEHNIAMWLFTLVTLIAIIGNVFYLCLKYAQDKHSSVMRVNKAIESDELNGQYEIVEAERDTPRQMSIPVETNEEIKPQDVQVEITNRVDNGKDVTFAQKLKMNFLELHPIASLFIPSVITPLSMRIAFFAFNFLTLCGFNAVFFTNEYLFDRYKDKDRNKFVFPMKHHFDKIISAIVCTMGITVLLRLIVIITYEKKQKLKNEISNKRNDRDIIISSFRKDMLLNRCICVFVMMIITAWFFYFSIAWCNRYPKAQHSWGHACAWSIMFNYILFSTVYIVIITAVQMKDSCERCTYYMKRTFMF